MLDPLMIFRQVSATTDIAVHVFDDLLTPIPFPAIPAQAQRI